MYLPVYDLLPDGGAHPVPHHDAHAVRRVRLARRLRQQVAAHLADVLCHLYNVPFNSIMSVLILIKTPVYYNAKNLKMLTTHITSQF